LSVQRLGGRSDRESGREGGGTELSCSTTGGEDGADSDVFNEARVDTRAFDERGEGADEKVGGLCVFEAALSAFCEGSAEGTCYYDLMIGLD
jgi:hypothetical protein